MKLNGSWHAAVPDSDEFSAAPEDLRVEVNGRQLIISGRRPVLSVIPVHGQAAASAGHRSEHGGQDVCLQT